MDEIKNLWDKILAYKVLTAQNFFNGLYKEFTQANFTVGSGFSMSSHIWLNF